MNQQILTFYGNYMSLREALVENKLIEYCISYLYGSELTFDEMYRYEREWEKIVINEADEPISPQSVQDVLKNNPNMGYDQARNLYSKLADAYRSTDNDMKRANAEDKGKMSLFIQQIKQAMQWVKNQMLKAKDHVSDWFNDKPKGYSAFQRDINTVNKFQNPSKSNTVNNTASDATPNTNAQATDDKAKENGGNSSSTVANTANQSKPTDGSVSVQNK